MKVDEKALGSRNTVGEDFFTAPGRFPYPGLFQGICLLIAGIFLLILGVTVVKVYAPGAEHNPWVLGSVNLFVLGSLLWFSWECAGGRFVQYFALRPVAWGLFGPMVLLVVGTSILASEADNVVRYLIGPPPASFDLSWLYLEAWRRPAGTLFLLVFVAPITEELLFRGLILRGLQIRHGDTRAVMLSAGLFALFHVNPWQMTGAFLIGGILGWWRVRTGSLVPCLLGHASYNVLPLVAMVVLPPIPGLTDIMPVPGFHPAVLDVVGAALALFGGVRVQRTFKCNGSQRPSPSSQEKV